MTCEHITMPDGSIIIACTRSARRKCKFCKRAATIACDFPVSGRESGTCDNPCCGAHAVYAGGKKDYCKDHAEKAT